jgi:DNA polymerase
MAAGQSRMNRDKRAALDQVARQIASCATCRRRGGGSIISGEGNPDAAVVFVGEAPGRSELQLRRPFVGRAGQWLRRAIRNIGLNEQDVYFANSIAYRPVDRKPTRADVAHGRIHLQKQLAIVDPRIVVLLGNTACSSVLQQNVAVRERHGTLVDREGATYLITCHPSAAARFPAIGRAVQRDFQRLKKILAQSQRSRAAG